MTRASRTGALALPLLLLPLLLALLLAGCGGGDGSDAGDVLQGGGDQPTSAPAPTQEVPSSDVPAGGSVDAVQPGAPGEPATSYSGGPVEGTDATHDDIAFMQMMVVHHHQAVRMGELARTRAADPRVRSVAERIAGAQAPEILVMAAWLRERSIDVPTPQDDPAEFDHADHGHDGMEGMLTPEQLDELADAEGAEFDELYLTGMIRHHRGAIAMAERALAKGTDLRVNEIASDVDVGQRAEIGRLEALLASL
ncbi:DUF305 domain-containing protein [Nocardioides sp. SYSU D00038]|uniref:DUF305 domain-containing protein n=1 Tax=Nocardioides sp. SYSU D00038 TaxID=2812554 RepID=UPI0019670657|nr:DUF305 domain-containing protein [Nocardioides sp. SYSU D00038]